MERVRDDLEDDVQDVLNADFGGLVPGAGGAAEDAMLTAEMEAELAELVRTSEREEVPMDAPVPSAVEVNAREQRRVDELESMLDKLTVAEGTATEDGDESRREKPPKRAQPEAATA